MQQLRTVAGHFCAASNQVDCRRTEGKYCGLDVSCSHPIAYVSVMCMCVCVCVWVCSAFAGRRAFVITAIKQLIDKRTILRLARFAQFFALSFGFGAFAVKLDPRSITSWNSPLCGCLSSPPAVRLATIRRARNVTSDPCQEQHRLSRHMCTYIHLPLISVDRTEYVCALCLRDSTA